jgi:hypothetical protein
MQFDSFRGKFAESDRLLRILTWSNTDLATEGGEQNSSPVARSMIYQHISGKGLFLKL